MRPVWRVLLVLTVVTALGLLLFIRPYVAALLELDHEVPNPWTPFDFVVIGLPISLLAIAIGAVVSLLRRQFLALWAGFALLSVDCLIFFIMIKMG